MRKIEFKSDFGAELERYRNYRSSLGYSNFDYFLRQVDRFFLKQGLDTKVIDSQTIESFCRKKSYETAANRYRRVSQFRQFCLFLAECGYDVRIPSLKGLPKPRKYDAHIFSDDELHRFFKALDHPKFSNAGTKRRDLILPLFFRILYTSGMRSTELASVKVADVDLSSAVITVRKGKGGKDRMVPFHPSLVKEFRRVLNLLQEPHNSPRDYVFQNRSGGHLTHGYFYSCFRRSLEQAGISHLGRGRGPRVHDFRHTYCVNLLRKWVRENRNLLAWMPYMQSMLGHSSFEETAYYLKLTSRDFPEVRDQIETKFPNLFKDPTYEEPEFY